MMDGLRLGPIEDEAELPSLIALLEDAVDDGASVGFLGPLNHALAADYWRNAIDDQARGGRIVLGAWWDGRLVGSVQLAFPSQENGKCRAEIQRLLVHRSARRRGIGRALIAELEDLARRDGRRVLFLNTRTGDPPEALYVGLGYQLVGTIPDFALNPDGTPNETSILFKSLTHPAS